MMRNSSAQPQRSREWAMPRRCTFARAGVATSGRCAVFLLAVASCSDATGPTTVTVSGVVSLATVWGKVQPSGGVVVGIDGTELEAVSQPDGRWTISRVPRGTHA